MTNWKIGKTSINGNEYTYQAKVFEEPSDFGIDCGRVSILTIRDSEGTEIISYYRGWDRMPKSAAAKKVYQHIMNIITK
ncbi:MAG: hypothetical protein LKE48_02780 [Solobacterium sp.]|jgi:hypothetical protein|nr:hypothetical protein [Solobacterium sp.]